MKVYWYLYFKIFLPYFTYKKTLLSLFIIKYYVKMKIKYLYKIWISSFDNKNVNF